MKLRQKLAAVMATAMVVTSVPTITIAATTNGISHTLSIAKDSTIGYEVSKADETVTYTIKDNVPSVELKVSGKYNFGAGETFFLQVENAKFIDEAFLGYEEGSLKLDEEGTIIEGQYAGKTVKEVIAEEDDKLAKFEAGNGDYTLEITKISDDEIKVLVTGEVEKDDVISVPLLAKAASGEVKVKIDGSDSFITSGTVTVATAAKADQKVTASVKEDGVAKLSVDGGKIGDVMLTEQVIGSLAGQKIKFELPSTTDLEFVESTVTLVGGRGFSGTKTTKATLDIKKNGEKDRQVLLVEIPASFADNAARGTVTIQGIQVAPENKTANKGKVEVTVSSEGMAKTKLTVAEIFDQLVTLTCKETAKVVAGKEAQTVEFTLAEQAKDSIIEGRKVEFTLDKGFIAVRDKEDGSYKTALETIQRMIEDKEIKLPEGIKASDITAAEANAEGQITGFTVVFDGLDKTKANSFKIEMPVMADLNTTGEVKLSVSGRAFTEEASVVVADVTAPITVTAEAVELKTGLNGQKGGMITLTETDKAMFDKGQVTIAMSEATGISFVKNQELDIKAEGLRVKDVKVTADVITFNVDRTSDNAGSIVIKGIEFNVNRTAPEGKFDVTVYGDAISENEYIKEGMDKLTVKDFIVIGTANTEDLVAANGLKKGTASFTIDSNKYTVNGVEKVMDGTVYASNGRTMVPVRYVSEAFGIDGNNITFNKGVVTLFAGSRIVQLTCGSNIAIVNGTSIPMDEKVTVKDGRTYIPMGEIGRILGVNVTWDNATKTATFKN